MTIVEAIATYHNAVVGLQVFMTWQNKEATHRKLPIARPKTNIKSFHLDLCWIHAGSFIAFLEIITVDPGALVG